MQSQQCWWAANEGKEKGSGRSTSVRNVKVLVLCTRERKAGEKRSWRRRVKEEDDVEYKKNDND